MEVASDILVCEPAAGTETFVLREKLKPFDCVDAVAGLLGGGIFFSSLAPSSSTRISFDGRNGLSSASTADDDDSVAAWAFACEDGVVKRGASVAWRPPRVPEDGVHDRLLNCVAGPPLPLPAAGAGVKAGLALCPVVLRSGPLKLLPRKPPR